MVNILTSIGAPPLVFLRFIINKSQALLLLLKQVWESSPAKKRGRKPTIKTRFKKSSLGNYLLSLSRSARWLKRNLLKKRRAAFLNQARFFTQKVWEIFSNAKERAKRLTHVFVSKKRFPKIVRESLLIASGALLSLFFIFLPIEGYQFVSSLPNPKTLSVRDIPVSTKIYDRNGVLLYQFYADENRSLINLSDLPKYVPEATIAIEDKNFYHHFGFDFFAMVRAALAITLGQSIQGGSTITQQLIKSALLTPEQTVSRKIKEIILSIWAESMYSKDQILTMYLNQVPYGGSTFGVQTAAQIYFGKNAKNLTLAEAAYLAGLPSAPSVYSPFGTRPDLAKKRQAQVLAAMVETKAITKEEFQKALSEKLNFENPETVIKAPHFVMYVKDYLVKKYGSRLVEQGGLEVTTSLDYKLYEKTNEMLRLGVERQSYLAVGNGAVLITNPKTGEILSMSGSTDFFNTTHDGNVNVTISERSPGSSIKPLNYALALEKNYISPSTIILDTPVSYQSDGQPPYRPQNYDNRFHGPVPARIALASSYNIPAVRLLEKNGLKNFIDFARKLGITTFTDPNRYGLALTLGGGEVTMVDMATAYSAFATGGYRVNLKPVLKVRDYLGHALEDNTTNDWQNQNIIPVISGRTAYLIDNILSDDTARAPTFGRGSILNIPGYQVAVKTGTTETKRDNWTIGFTPNFLVAVWVGNNDNSPMSPFLESGNTGAAAIWNPIFQEVLKDQPTENFSPPANIIPIQICATNGLLPCENCPLITTELFVSGTEPKIACNFTRDERDRLLKQTQNTTDSPSR